MRHSGTGDPWHSEDADPTAVPGHWPERWSVDPDWFEREDFWEMAGPALFPPARWIEAELDTSDVLALLGLTPPAAILDMACGPGRYLLPLARLGYRVTGVDRSPGFCDEARTRAGAEGLEIPVLCADLRDLTNALPSARFDGALWLDSSIGYGDEAFDRTVLRALGSLLRPGARLVIETLGFECVVGAEPDSHASENAELEAQRVGDEEWMVERRVSDTGWMEVRWGSRTGMPRAYRHRLYSREAICKLLREVGYCNVLLYGDLYGSEYGSGSATMVAVAEI